MASIRVFIEANDNHSMLVSPMLTALAAQLEGRVLTGRFELIVENGMLFISDRDGVEAIPQRRIVEGKAHAN